MERLLPALGLLTACAHNPDSLRPERTLDLSRREAGVVEDLAIEVMRRQEAIKSGSLKSTTPIGEPGTPYLLRQSEESPVWIISDPNPAWPCYLGIQDSNGGDFAGDRLIVRASDHGFGIKMNSNDINCDKGQGDSLDCTLTTGGPSALEDLSSFSWHEGSEVGLAIEEICKKVARSF